jgi:hypothetical protein
MLRWLRRNYCPILNNLENKYPAARKHRRKARITASFGLACPSSFQASPGSAAQSGDADPQLQAGGDVLAHRGDGHHRCASQLSTAR